MLMLRKTMAEITLKVLDVTNFIGFIGYSIPYNFLLMACSNLFVVRDNR